MLHKTTIRIHSFYITKKKKFTFAELEENEDGVQKLENWLARIQARDLVGGERTNQAVQLVEDCKRALAEFAERVYYQEQVLSKKEASE